MVANSHFRERTIKNKMLTDDERKYFEEHFGNFTNIDIELYFKPVADRDSE